MDEGGERERAEAVLATVRAVAAELHPGRPAGAVALESRLDRDLGFDSLGRLELVARLERDFAVSLPERAAVDAETPQDLLHAILAAPRRSEEGRPRRASPAAGPAGEFMLPEAAATWVEVLEWHAARQPQAMHVRFFRDEGEDPAITYGELLDGARRTAAGLLRGGLEARETVAIMLPTGADYLQTFLGVLFASGIPVPLYPPFRSTQLDDHLKRQAGIVANSQAAVLVTTPELKMVARLLVAQVPSLRTVTTPNELAAATALSVRPSLAGANTAFLQYTSGSTGSPKGVVLSHANLLANVRAMGRAVAVRPGDVMVSWLPLYHDMGLIGAWLGSLYHGLPLILMSPLAFVARPARWLRAVDRYRGTLSAAPNFAYELCLRRIDDADRAGLDLSSLRSVFNGAEPISPETMLRFIERFAPSGFRREAMMPVYGLAECSVGLAFPPLGRGPVIDAVQRSALTVSGRAIPAEPGDPHAVRLVACGRPLPGHEIRTVDAADRELPERHEGRIQFRGPSATSGYFRNSEASAALFHGTWLDTGDLGYIADGEIHVTGRAKDLIIRAGRNIYPDELEAAIGELPGIRKGNVAAFGMTDPRDGTERLVVVAETRKTAETDRRALEARIADAAVDLLGLPPDRIVLAPPNTVLKTSSGKIRRAASRRLLEEGDLGRKRRPVWRQWASLEAATLRPRLGRGWGRLLAAGRAGWSWLVVGMGAPVGWLAVVLLPRTEWRWAALRGLLRFTAWATGTRVAVKGVEAVPAGPVVFAANHCSYLDGFVLAATLGRPLTFVAKEELNRRWYTALPLRRLGTAFVDRLDREKAAEQAGRLVAQAKGGLSLVYFPEATFTRMPGLLPFRMGAFLAAAETGLPIVPVALRGTRSVLRADSWFPRPGPVAVTVSEALPPDRMAGESAWEQAIALRDATRQAILRASGEPDLAYEPPPV